MVTVVIPCYRVKDKIGNVIKGVGPEVQHIIAVDDCCPEGSGDYIRSNITDARVTVIKTPQNLGVGGAVKTGFKLALELGSSIVVKMDGDGQMDPERIPVLIKPVQDGRADYAKGNRFFYPDELKKMPKIRLMGNLGLNFLVKMSSGYWKAADPTNGFFAINRNVLAALPLEKIDNRYFFESDMLFRLGTLRAKVADVPMQVIYDDENSGLSVVKTLFVFPAKLTKSFVKRLGYNYFIRDFNFGSLALVGGSALTTVSVALGVYLLILANITLEPTPLGIVLWPLLLFLVGFYMLIGFVYYDIESEPREPIGDLLIPIKKDSSNEKP